MNDVVLVLVNTGAVGVALAIHHKLHRRAPRRAGRTRVDDHTETTRHASADRGSETRPLDTVVVTCENLAHGAAGEPATEVLTYARCRDDIDRMRRNGWGDDHINICRVHNPGLAIPLRTVHVRCGSDGCQERDTISLHRGRADFGLLNRYGWRNTSNSLHPVCPYHSGTRRR